MSRIMIFTGKGGVGKTSIAAAHARKAALEGKKTLVVSTDMAHNLGDLFDCPIGGKEKQIEGNLYALEIDPYYEMTNDFAPMLEAFKALFSSGIGKEDIFEEIEMFPGIEELFSLLKIHKLHKKGEYDLIIVDCAPTGETLSLLKFPELLSWYMEKLFPIEKAVIKVMRPVSKKLFKLELPDGKALNDIERLYYQLAKLQELLRDREVTSIRLVAIPEKMVVEEIKRSYMYLNLYNFNVDGLYINRVLPRDIENPFFEEWVDIQKKYGLELEEVFREIPIYLIKWYDIDLNGLASLDRLVRDALTDPEIFEVKRNIMNEIYEKVEDGFLLKVYIPCAEKGKIDLYESGTDLIIKIGNFKRNIPLPNALRNYKIRQGKMEGEELKLFFIGN
ncbi:MAG: ArsA family ATPase [Eubacteriaceae bacterium]